MRLSRVVSCLRSEQKVDDRVDGKPGLSTLPGKDKRPRRMVTLNMDGHGEGTKKPDKRVISQWQRRIKHASS
jgi:hypothetical protein